MLNVLRMKKLRYSTILLAGMLFLTSCEKQVVRLVSFGETSDIEIKDTNNFSASIVYEGSDLALKEYSVAGKIRLKSNIMDKEFLLESTITSPTVNDEKLSASFVEIIKLQSEVRAYITYNLSGAQHGGALLVVDLTNPESPKIKSEVLFKDIDINVCEVYHSGKML